MSKYGRETVPISGKISNVKKNVRLPVGLRAQRVFCVSVHETYA